MNSITRLLQIMATLRDPVKGCPWDREQDFASIVPYTIEESYEVAEAIERNDMQALCGELGDLLFQVIYHAQMAAEQGYFGFDEVVAGINSKLLQRHPHVFGNERIEDAKSQSLAWERLKMEERVVDSGSILDGIGLNFPALSRAQKLQKRAANVGFDWKNIQDVITKIHEETGELEEEISSNADKQKVEEELGDLLFSCVNLARHLELDAEAALRKANTKFERRFHYIEAAMSAAKSDLTSTTLEEMDKLWEESKSVR